MTVFKNLIGKRINGILLGNDAWTVVFRTTEGEYFRYNTGNDCCNSVWTENRDGSDEGHEVIQDGFYTLHTDRGYIDIEVRNSHNGYYGGTFNETDEVDLQDIEDLQEITNDF